MTAPGTVRRVAGVDVVELSGTSWRLTDGTVVRVRCDEFGLAQWIIDGDETTGPVVVAGSLAEAIQRHGAVS